MDQTTTGLVMILALLVVLTLGFPIALSLLVIGIVAILGTQGWAAGAYLIGNFPYAATAEYGFLVIPLFLFMGQVAFSAGVSVKAFAAAKAWFGHVPGGLGIAAIAACAGFATVSGSSIATAATIARIAVPEMLRAGYSRALTGACVATGGTIGVLIPPSGILVVYSIATETSIPQLFTAAIVPGIFTAVVYGIGVHLLVKRDPTMKAATQLPREAMGQRLRLTFASWEIIVLFGTVMGVLYSGIASPTEAAAYGAGIALVLALLKGHRWETIRCSLVDSGSSTAAIFFLIIGAGIFSTALATTQIPQELGRWVGGLGLPPTLLLFLLVIPFLFLGCFIDAISMILLTMPVVFPIVKAAGIDPILFGIIVTKMTEIGNITPPVGLNVFVVSTTCPELKVGEIFSGIMPFFLMELLIVAVLILIPEITLFAVR